MEFESMMEDASLLNKSAFRRARTLQFMVLITIFLCTGALFIIKFLCTMIFLCFNENFFCDGFVQGWLILSLFVDLPAGIFYFLDANTVIKAHKRNRKLLRYVCTFRGKGVKIIIEALFKFGIYM